MVNGSDDFFRLNFCPGGGAAVDSCRVGILSRKVEAMMTFEAERMRQAGVLRLRDNLPNDVPVDIRQTKIASRVSVCEPLVIQSHQV